MRLHHLSATAFGPFATTVDADFDALADGRLFLLTGATGSGKTSVLDAVCFALYGDVPGDRAAAGRLRSDLADPATRTQVTLECTLGGRRFRVVRSPAWERPKKRGAGLTTEPAKVTLSERCADEWVHRSSRIDETAHLVTDLIGLTQTQFTQVAMLPQGRFQAFLRADSDSRQQLLQQIFRTGRFEQVERWLRDLRLELKASATLGHDTVAGLAHRLCEATDTPLPPEWDEHDLGPAADEGRLDAWSAALLDAAREQTATALGAVHAATAARSITEQRLADGRSLAERQARHASAAAALQQLESRSCAHEAERLRLEAARRAAPLVPLATRADQCATAAEASLAHAAVATRRVTDLHGGSNLPQSAEEFAAARDRAVATAATLATVATRARAAAALESQVTVDTAALDDLTTRRATLDDELGRLPGQVADLETGQATAAAAASALGSTQAQVTEARRRHEHAQHAAALTPALDEARDQLRAATDDAQECREVWLEIQEARLTGMAAELAHDLAVGACCPVCGSVEHPHLATPVDEGPVTEKAARRTLDDAQALRQLHDHRVRDLEKELALAHDRAGGDLDATAARVEALVAEEALLTEAAAPLATLTSRLAAARDRLARVAEEHAALLLEESALRSASAARVQELVAHRDAVAAAMTDTGHDDPDALASHHRALASACDDAATAVAAASRAAEEFATAASSAGRAAAAAGFDDIRAVHEAALSSREIEVLATAVQRHTNELASLRALAGDPELVEAAAVEPPDIEALVAADDVTAQALTTAVGDHRVATARALRLEELHREFVTALAEWLPLRREHDSVAQVADLAQGRGHHNPRRMRLSAYVLGFRLTQVVAAANERLSGMSDRRYSLERSEERVGSETRRGLGLVVRDDWSGERRAPSTLSGGETFVVSLALALGLADVITQEAGGADLDTLFVDEGFGSLDADTLDDVMDTLDSLRAGGRVVGVVSHVAEMRDRIPTQLAVHKGRRGSTVSVVAG